MAPTMVRGEVLGGGGVEDPADAPLDVTCTTAAVLVENLPHDLAARVFATLPPHTRARCAAVCKSWRDIMKELPPEQLWGELDFTTDPSFKVRTRSSVVFVFFCTLTKQTSLFCFPSCCR